jgi:hypothetical protein
MAHREVRREALTVEPAGQGLRLRMVVQALAMCVPVGVSFRYAERGRLKQRAKLVPNPLHVL